MYPITIWVDETDEYEDRFNESMNEDGSITHTKVRGTVYVEGTPQDAAHFNNLENGVYDAHAATALLVNALRQAGWRIEDLEKATVQETGTVTLNNSQAFPFNNSIVTIPLTNVRDNLYYVVEIISVVPAGGGNAGEIVVSERQVNGFKMAFTGSASSVAVTYAVIGGYDK